MQYLKSIQVPNSYFRAKVLVFQLTLLDFRVNTHNPVLNLVKLLASSDKTAKP